MKKVFILLLSALLSDPGFCQLLDDPALTIADLEKALTNPAHLGSILSGHDFILKQGKTGKVNPYSIENPLQPDLETVKSEYWIKKPDSTSATGVPGIILRINLDEWKSGCGPYPGVIKSLSVWIRKNPDYKERVNKFFESVRENYPDKIKKYPTGLSRQYSYTIEIFTKEGSKIAVRTTYEQPYYVVTFDLLK